MRFSRDFCQNAWTSSLCAHLNNDVFWISTVVLLTRKVQVSLHNINSWIFSILEIPAHIFSLRNLCNFQFHVDHILSRMEKNQINVVLSKLCWNVQWLYLILKTSYLHFEIVLTLQIRRLRTAISLYFLYLLFKLKFLNIEAVILHFWTWNPYGSAGLI